VRNSIIFLLFLLACTPERVDLHKRFLGTLSIKNLKNTAFDQPIIKPENTKFALLEIEKFNSNTLKKESDCLFIKTPYKRSPGVLFIGKKTKSTCKQLLYKNHKKVFEFRKLSFNISREEMILTKDDKRISIILPNLKKNSATFMSAYSFKKDDYLKILPPVLKENLKKYTQITKYSHPEASPFSINTKKCHSVDAKCRSKKEYACDSCPYGFIEVVGGLCPKGGDKYCAPVSCGGVGEIACYRGSVHPAGYGKLACQNDSVEGLCNFGLKTICQNGILFCR
jgi:hypothetical protein